LLPLIPSEKRMTVVIDRMNRLLEGFFFLSVIQN
jgi:hypothetical protein